MRTSLLLACTTLFAALGSAPALASDHDHDHDHDHERRHHRHEQQTDGDGPGMQAIALQTAPGERGHGWQYFSDPIARRAVVISPEGDYYYSRGKGLRWVAAAPSGI